MTGISVVYLTQDCNKKKRLNKFGVQMVQNLNLELTLDVDLNHPFHVWSTDGYAWLEHRKVVVFSGPFCSSRSMIPPY